MKPRQLLTAAAVTSIALLSAVSPALASVPAEVATRAQDACVNSAQSEGFTLRRVRSTDSVDADTVRVILNLDRDNQEFKLTCNYSIAQNSVTVNDDSIARVARPLVNPWLALLIPLIGLPLLLALTRGREDETVNAARNYSERSEGTVRTAGEMLDIYDGPGASYRVVGNLRNGQRIVLTGRYENDWAQIESGGWVPTRYLDSVTRYAQR